MRPVMRAARPKPPRSDPAPSRWAWRIERWMLTPGIRFALRVGVPFALALAGGLVYFSEAARRDALVASVAEIRTAIETRPEFMVGVLRVTGASDEVAADIREIMPVDLPASSFDIDLEGLRETITGLDPVRSATVRIRPGGVLDVHVTERVPVLVWRSYEQVALIDAEGAHVALLETRLARPDLPLIAGDGADAHAAEALELIRAAEPLGDRLRGLVRMGARRWDVVLDRGQRIMLPETGARRALERAIALDAAQDLLARDLVRVDLRLEGRPTVRVAASATEAWFDIRARNLAARGE